MEVWQVKLRKKTATPGSMQEEQAIQRVRKDKNDISRTFPVYTVEWELN